MEEGCVFLYVEGGMFIVCVDGKFMCGRCCLLCVKGAV